MAKRQNAMLTSKQREYLKTGGRGISRSAQSQHRSNIRERVKETVKDFSLIYDELPAEEREEVFTYEGSRQELDEGFADFIALLYYHTHLGGRFRNLLWRGVSKAESDIAGVDLMANVEFSVEPLGERHYEAALEKFRHSKLGEMSSEEALAIVHLMRRSRAIGPEELHQARESMIEQIEEIIEEQDAAKWELNQAKREQQADRMNDE